MNKEEFKEIKDEFVGMSASERNAAIKEAAKIAGAEIHYVMSDWIDKAINFLNVFCPIVGILFWIVFKVLKLKPQDIGLEDVDPHVVLWVTISFFVLWAVAFVAKKIRDC